jgi:hypothetical protein
LACRLHDAANRGEWVPPKRVAAAPPGRVPTRAGVYRIRERAARESHAAFAEARRRGDLAVFADVMAPFVSEYRARTRPSLFVRAFLLARRLLRAVFACDAR